MLPTGWGDFMIIQRKGAIDEAKRIYERKTVADLKSSIFDANRHGQFKMFCGIAEKEDILGTIILETAVTDRFLKPPQFSADLREYRPGSKITNYNCRAFLNSLSCRLVISASVVETAIFFFTKK